MPQTWPGGGTIRLIWSLGGQDEVVNVLNFQEVGAQQFSTAYANQIFDVIAGRLTSATAFRGNLSSAYALARLTVRDMSEPFQPEYVSTRSPVPGTGAAEVLPLSAAICVTSRTALAGRSFRGRTYLSGFTEAVNIGNQPATAAVNNSRTFMTNVDGDLLDALFIRLGVVSKYSGGVERPEALYNRTIAYDAPTGRWTSQRRRNVPGI